MIQPLRLCASTARDAGSNPGGGTKIPHAVGVGKKRKERKKKVNNLSQWRDWIWGRRCLTCLNQGSGGGMSKGLAEGGVDRITCKGCSQCGLRASCPSDQRMKPPKTGTRSLEKE